METLNVVLKLNDIVCHDEGDGWGSAEPYLWTIFFKIDGQSVWQNGVSLDGQADFFFSHGSHENLPNTDVDPGEIVPIPSNVGEWSTILRPIELDFLGAKYEIPGIVGVVTVLMEEDNVSDDGAEAGHRALNNHVRNAINNFISNIDLLDFAGADDSEELLQEKIDTLIAEIKSNINGVVADAIQSNQNWLEDLWAWINKDDQIGNKVWTFSADDIIEANYEITLNQRWKNHGDWEIRGELSASELCPASAVSSLSSRLFKQSLSLSKLRVYRDHIYKEFPQSTQWWKIAIRNSPFIIREMQKDKTLAKRVYQLAKTVESQLDIQEAFDNDFYQEVDNVLQQFCSSRFKSLRMDSRRVRPVIKDLKGKNLKGVLSHLEGRKPLKRPE